MKDYQKPEVEFINLVSEAVTAEPLDEPLAEPLDDVGLGNTSNPF